MAVTDVESGKSLRLGEAGELYSGEWLAAMGEPRGALRINRTRGEERAARGPQRMNAQTGDTG
jgi:hypothetical protein